MTARVLGLDVGGATLKAADGRDRAVSRPFPLWQRPADLPDELSLLAQGFKFDAVALTMTGELCDAFSTKDDGVRAITRAVERTFGGVPIRVWTTDGKFATAEEARLDPWSTASANWLALATFAGRFAPHGPALLVDVGSTTTDVVGLVNGRPTPIGRADPDRLASGELVYQGVWRTPICAVLSEVEIGGRCHATMAELFATTADAYLVLGAHVASEDSHATADGRPADLAHALGRLAKMIGADATRFSESDARTMAAAVRREQKRRIAAAIGRVASQLGIDRFETVLLAGQGEFLARDVLAGCPATRSSNAVSLSEKLGADASRAACAHAVSILFAEAFWVRIP